MRITGIAWAITMAFALSLILVGCVEISVSSLNESSVPIPRMLSPNPAAEGGSHPSTVPTPVNPAPPPELPPAAPPPEMPPSPAPSGEPGQSNPEYGNPEPAPVSNPGFIDRVYAWDLETSSIPRGRALVEGKTYEIIAENRVPFTEYVRFTVLLDGNEVESAEARCPESCASESMYSVPLTIPTGDYREIRILAEDANGTKGESVAYTYADTPEAAEHLAEACHVPAEVGAYPAGVANAESAVHGATITEGWPAGTTVHTYSGHGNLTNLCYNLTASSPVAGGYLAQTWCKVSAPYDIWTDFLADPVSCTCACTASTKDIGLSTDMRVDFPNWAEYDTAPQCQKDEWNRFLAATKTHEEGHIHDCIDAQPGILAEVENTPPQKADGASCKMACDAAVERLRSTVNSRLTNAYNRFYKQPTMAYDTATNHGDTQGALLDCQAC